MHVTGAFSAARGEPLGSLCRSLFTETNSRGPGSANNRSRLPYARPPNKCTRRAYILYVLFLSLSFAQSANSTNTSVILNGRDLIIGLWLIDILWYHGVYVISLRGFEFGLAQAFGENVALILLTVSHKHAVHSRLCMGISATSDLCEVQASPR